MKHSTVLILDFGSQYTQLIARRVREAGVYCEILPCHASIEEIRTHQAQALILSGGPASVYDADAPKADVDLLNLNLPILGICYGMQWLAKNLGGRVEAGTVHEYGPARIHIEKSQDIFAGFTQKELKVWMSHGDHVVSVPENFSVYARSTNQIIAAMGHSKRKIFGLQFHPEVVHTDQGTQILRHFLFEVAGLKGDWSMASFVEEKTKEIREEVGASQVLCAVSGGVDSSVMAALIHQAVGDQLVAVFVDNGVLRKGEAERVPELFRKYLDMNIDRVDAAGRFLKRLAGIEDPEEKRKRIGLEFIEVFEEEAKRFDNIEYLAQGTLYPDVIESVSARGGPSVTIKSHHNVGGLPERMHLKLIEPFRELFKDEVREIGRLIGVPEELIGRQPFPGPGLAVRILGEVTEERLGILRDADEIILQEFKESGLYSEIWQSFGVLLPVKTVGVMGDARTYENVIALRAVESRDGMTANWVHLPYELLAKISSRIINEVRGVNRVVYDISSKPPATIEWE